MKKSFLFLCAMLVAAGVMPCIAQSNIVPQPPTGNPNGYWTTEEGRFSACNEQGLILWYSVITDSTVMIVGSNSNLETQYDETNYAYITADTIIVPARFHIITLPTK